eukprot:342763_1
MSLTLQRLLCVPRRMARTLLAASSNTYHSRIYLSTESEPTDENENETKTDSNDLEIPLENLPPSHDKSTPRDYSHYLSEKPDYEHGRKMRIYMPSKAAGTQGVAKVGTWRVEALNPGARWGNPLMGWTSTRDPLQSINHGLDRFETKEHAIQWCVSNGFDYEIMEPKTPKRRPKNYAATFGKNGLPKFDNDNTNKEDDNDNK